MDGVDSVLAAMTSSTVQVDDGSEIPVVYADDINVFSEEKGLTLPLHRETNHAIEIVPGKQVPYGRLYNLSEAELHALKAYLETNMTNGFIQRSSSSAAALIVFTKKKNGSLRLCVDYRALNAITVKNQYPLPLISEMLDRMRDAKVFTKLDLRGAYNLIHIHKGDEWKTAFRT